MKVSAGAYISKLHKSDVRDILHRSVSPDLSKPCHKLTRDSAPVMSPNLIWASLQKSYYGGWKFQRALFVSWTAGGSIVPVLISCGVEFKFCSRTERLNYNWPRSWCKIVLLSLHLWAGVGTEGSFGRASGGSASEPGLHSEDWPGTKEKSLQEWNPQHVLSIWIKTNKNSFI